MHCYNFWDMTVTTMATRALVVSIFRGEFDLGLLGQRVVMQYSTFEQVCKS